MPNKCCVPGCRGNYRNGPKVNVFQFPSDPSLRKKWIECIPKANLEVTRNTVVCQKHFASYFVKTEDRFLYPDGRELIIPRGKLKLEPNAYPTIFNFNDDDGAASTSTNYDLNKNKRKTSADDSTKDSSTAQKSLLPKACSQEAIEISGWKVEINPCNDAVEQNGIFGDTIDDFQPEVTPFGNEKSASGSSKRTPLSDLTICRNCNGTGRVKISTTVSVQVQTESCIIAHYYPFSSKKDNKTKKQENMSNGQTMVSILKDNRNSMTDIESQSPTSESRNVSHVNKYAKQDQEFEKSVFVPISQPQGRKAVSYAIVSQLKDNSGHDEVLVLTYDKIIHGEASSENTSLKIDCSKNSQNKSTVIKLSTDGHVSQISNQENLDLESEEPLSGSQLEHRKKFKIIFNTEENTENRETNKLSQSAQSEPDVIIAKLDSGGNVFYVNSDEKLDQVYDKSVYLPGSKLKSKKGISNEIDSQVIENSELDGDLNLEGDNRLNRAESSLVSSLDKMCSLSSQSESREMILKSSENVYQENYQEKQGQDSIYPLSGSQPNSRKACLDEKESSALKKCNQDDELTLRVDSAAYRPVSSKLPLPKFNGNNYFKIVKDVNSSNINLIQKLVLKSDIKKKDWTCSFCQEKFMYKFEIETHRFSIHKSINTRYDGKTLVLRLKGKKITKRYPGFCEICGKYYSDSFKLRFHKMLHSNKAAFQCDICHKNLASPRILKGHRQIHETEQNRSVQICERCGKTFSTRRILKVHLETGSCGSLVEAPKTFQCSECTKAFHTEKGLRVHHSNVHQVHLDLNKGNSDLKSKATKEKLHQCDYCPKSFACQMLKREHMNVHLGLRPFECSFCSKTFHSKMARSWHELYHKGKQYSCNTCPAKFVKSQHLKQHQRIHTGEKPYACSVCGMHFRFSGDRNRHERRHSEKKDIDHSS